MFSLLTMFGAAINVRWQFGAYLLEYAISALQWVLVTKSLRTLLATMFLIVLANLIALKIPYYAPFIRCLEAEKSVARSDKKIVTIIIKS